MTLYGSNENKCVKHVKTMINHDEKREVLMLIALDSSLSFQNDSKLLLSAGVEQCKSNSSTKA